MVDVYGYCVHSDVREECLECIDKQISFWQSWKEKILDKRLQEASEEHPYYEGETIMPIVDGRTYKCHCGCNVFHMHFDAEMNKWLYVCNGCMTEYEGVRKSA